MNDCTVQAQVLDSAIRKRINAIAAKSSDPCRTEYILQALLNSDGFIEYLKDKLTQDELNILNSYNDVKRENTNEQEVKNEIDKLNNTLDLRLEYFTSQEWYKQEIEHLTDINPELAKLYKAFCELIIEMNVEDENFGFIKLTKDNNIKLLQKAGLEKYLTREYYAIDNKNDMQFELSFESEDEARMDFASLKSKSPELDLEFNISTDINDDGRKLLQEFRRIDFAQSIYDFIRDIKQLKINSIKDKQSDSNEEKLDINRILDNLDNDRVGDLLENYYQQKVSSVAANRSSNSNDVLLGFSSGEALNLAKIETGNVIKELYRKNQTLPKERRLKVADIIRRTISILTQRFYNECVNPLIEENLKDIVEDLSRDSEGQFTTIGSILEALESRTDEKYASIKQYLSAQFKLAELMEQYKHEPDDNKALVIKEEYSRVARGMFTYAENIVHQLAKDVTNPKNIIYNNWANLISQTRVNTKEWFDKTISHPSFIKIVRNFSDTVRDLNEEEDEDYDSIEEDKDEQMKNQTEKEVKDYDRYFDSVLNDYLSSIPRLKSIWKESDTNGDYDTDNELGVITYLSPTFVKQQLLSQCNTNSKFLFIESIKKLAQRNKELNGLSKIARDILKDPVLFNRLFVACRNYTIDKAIIYTANMNYAQSNPQVSDATISFTQIRNEISSSFRGMIGSTTVDIIETLMNEINANRVGRNKDVDWKQVSKVFMDCLLQIVPNIDVEAINSYIEANKRNHKGLIHLAKIIANLTKIYDEVNSVRNEEFSLLNERKDKYYSLMNLRNRTKNLEQYLDDRDRDLLKITTENGETTIEYPRWIDEERIERVTDKANPFISQLAKIITQYGTSRVELNSTNAENNLASDIVKPNFVTRLFDEINFTTDDNTPITKNPALLRLKERITKGDKLSNQYTYHPIFFGVNMNGVQIPGIFTRDENGEISINPNAKEIITLHAFNGTFDESSNTGILYDSMSVSDYFISQFIVFKNSIKHQNDAGIYTNTVGNYTRAHYFLRTPSDKPTNRTIGYFNLNRRALNASVTAHVIQEICNFITQLGNVCEIVDGKYYIKENGTPVGNNFERQHYTGDASNPIYMENGKLAGNIFNFNKLFAVNGYDAAAEIESALSLYGEGPNNVIIKDSSNGRYYINKEFIGRLYNITETSNENLFGSGTIKTTFINNNRLTERISEIVDKWFDAYLNEAKNDTGRLLIDALNAADVMEYTEEDMDLFLLNNVNMLMNYDMMFEGDGGFYKNPQDFLKRTQEIIANGTVYNGWSILDPPFGEIRSSIGLDGAPEIIKVKVKKGGELTTYDVPNGRGASYPLDARNGFTAVTVNNTIRKSKRINDLTKELEDIYISQGMSEEDAKRIAKNSIRGLTGNTKVDDAQSYITLDEFIRRRYADGTIDEYYDIIAQLLDPDVKVEDIDISAINARIQVGKNVYYDMNYDYDSGLYYPRYIKNAEFVLIPKLLPEGSALRKLHDIMVENDISQINTAETSKAAKKNVLDLWNGHGGIREEFANEAKKVKENFYYRYLYQQQKTPQHMQDAQNKAGIQIMSKIIDNAMTEYPEIADTVKQYFTNYSENIEESFNLFITDCGWKIKDGKLVNDDGSEKLDYTRMFYRARQEAQRRGLNSQQLDALTPNEYGVPDMPLIMNLNGDKFQNILMALINERVTRQKLPGYHGVQVTNVGYDESLKYHPQGYKKDNKYISKEDYDKLEDKTGWKEAPQPYIEIRIPRWSAKIPKASENMSDEDIIKMLEEQGLDKMVIYRIPTEGKQSIAVAKVVGFVDECYGSTIIVPDEWVTQTGSDFDIDSIYAVTFEMYKTKDGKVRKVNPISENSTELELRNAYSRYVNSNLDRRLERGTITQDDYDNKLIEVKNRLSRQEERDDLSDTFEQEMYFLKSERSLLPKKYKDIIYSSIEEANKIEVETKSEKLINSLSFVTDALEDELENETNEDIKSQVQHYIESCNEIYNILTAQRGLRYTKEEFKSEISKDLAALREKYDAEYFASIDRAAIDLGLPSFEEWCQLPIHKRNTVEARNNIILQCMIDIMSHPSSLTENLATSNFRHITEGKNICDEALGISSINRSIYNPLDNIQNQENAVSGMKLKGISVNFDSFASICNYLHVTLGNDEIAWNRDGNKNSAGELLTVYSSETTAYILDIMKEGALRNVNTYTFPAFKYMILTGMDYTTALAFMYQPGVEDIVRIYNESNSIYNNNSSNAINMAIIRKIKELMDEDENVQNLWSFKDVFAAFVEKYKDIIIDLAELKNKNADIVNDPNLLYETLINNINTDKLLKRLNDRRDKKDILHENRDQHISTAGRGYTQRTIENARWSDITIALAEDFSTAGEILTAEAAGGVVETIGKRRDGRDKKKIIADGGKYVSAMIKNSNPQAVAEQLFNKIINMGLPTRNIKLNVAGNGIYTFGKNRSLSQEQLDNFVTQVIRELLAKGITISQIRSGGQSGVDEAGIKAAQRLGIDYHIAMPKDYDFIDRNRNTHKGRKATLDRFGLKDGEESQEAINNAVFDILQMLTYKRLHSKGGYINKVLNLTKPDKFGAKQDLYETNRVLRDIRSEIEYELIHPERTVRTSNYGLIEAMYPEEARKVYEHILNNKSTYQEERGDDFIERIEYKYNAGLRDAKYEYKNKFLERSTKLATRLFNELFILDNDEYYNHVGICIEGIIGRQLTQEEQQKFKKFIVSNLYSHITMLSNPVTLDNNGNIVVIQENSQDEINRINGYISTTEDISVDFGDKDSGGLSRSFYEDALNTFRKYTPTQKVEFIQKNFSTDRGIFEFITTTTFNGYKYREYGYSGAKLRVKSSNIDEEDLFKLFTESFNSDNEFIRLAAIDLIKYAFIVEHDKFNKGSISRIIPNFVKLDNLFSGGTNIVDEFNVKAKNDLYQFGLSMITRFIRANPEMVPSVKIPQARTVHGVYSITEEYKQWLNSESGGGLKILTANHENLMAKLGINPNNVYYSNGKVFNITFRENNESKTVLYRVKISDNGAACLIPMPRLDENDITEYSYNMSYNEGFYPEEEYYNIIEHHVEHRPYSPTKKIEKPESKSTSNASSDINYLDKQVELDANKSLIAGINVLKDYVFNKENGLQSDYNNTGVVYAYLPNYQLKEVIGDEPLYQRLTGLDSNDNEVTITVKITKIKNIRKESEGYATISSENYELNNPENIPGSTYRIEQCYDYKEVDFIDDMLTIGRDRIDEETRRMINEEDDEIEYTMSSAIIRPIGGITYAEHTTTIFETGTNKMISAIYDLAEKGDEKAKELKDLFYKNRINRTSQQNINDNAKFIYENAAEYIECAVEDLVQRASNFDINGTIYDISDDDLYNNLGDFNNVNEFVKYNELVKLLLDIKTFGSYISDLTRLQNNDEINNALDKINAAYNRLMTETNIKDAMYKLFNIYFAKYSTNPLIKEGIVKLREQFGDSGWLDHWIADIGHIRNKEVQIVVKLVNSMLNEATRILAPNAKKEFQKKYDEINGRPGPAIDFSKFIDENHYLRQNYTQEFIDKKKELDEEVEDARNTFTEFSKEYVDAYIKREKFLIKNTHRKIVESYYQRRLDNIERLYNAHPDTYIEYMRLLSEYNDPNLMYAAGSDAEYKRKVDIRYRINMMTEEFDVNAMAPKTGIELVEAKALKEFIKEKNEISNSYFDKTNNIEWENTFNTYKTYVDNFDAANPGMTLNEKFTADSYYEEAYRWIKLNTVEELPPAAQQQLNDALEIINKNGTGEGHEFTVKVKHYAKTNDALDLLGNIDARKFTDAQIAHLRQQQIDSFDYYYDAEDSYLDEDFMIKDTPRKVVATKVVAETYKQLAEALPWNPDRNDAILEYNNIMRQFYSNGKIDTIKAAKTLTDYEIDLILGYINDILHPDNQGNVPQEIIDFTEYRDAHFEYKVNNARFNEEKNKAQTQLTQEERVRWQKLFAHVINNRIEANEDIFGYWEAQPAFVDGVLNDASDLIHNNVETVPNEYYEEAVKEATRNGTLDDFLRKNTIYNAITREYEPLRIWTQRRLKDNNSLGVTYSRNATYENSTKTVSPLVDNEVLGLYDPDKVNYNSNTGDYNDNYLLALTDKERDMRQLFIDTLEQYRGFNYKLDRALNTGILPRELIMPWDTKKVAREIFGTVGLTIDTSWNKPDREEDPEYINDEVNMITSMEMKKTKDFEEEEEIRERAVGESAQDYYNYIRDVRQKNKEIRERNRARERQFLSNDYRDMFGKFILETVENRAIEDIKNTIYVLIEELKDNPAYNINSKGRLAIERRTTTVDQNNYRRISQDNTLAVVQNWARRKLYKDYSKHNKLRSLANSTQIFTSAKFMIGNIYSGIANVNTGYVNMTMERFAGDYFTNEDCRKAQQEYLKGVPSYINTFFNLEDKTKFSTRTDALIHMFNVVEYDRIFERLPGESLTKFNARCRDALYSFQSMGEHWMQNVVLLACLKGTRIYYDPITKTKRLFSQKQFIGHIELEALRVVLDDVDPALRQNFEDFVNDIVNDKKELYKYDTFKKDFVQEWLKKAFFDGEGGLDKTAAKDVITKFKAKVKEMQQTRKNEFANLKTVDSQLDFVDGEIKIIETNDLDSLDTRLIGEMIERVIMINKKIHGVYDKDGAAMLEREWYGSLMMQYHKHIWPGAMKHWRRRGYYNEIRQTIERGMYSDSLRFIANTLPFYDNFVAKREGGDKIIHALFSSALHTVIEMPTRIKIESQTMPKYKIDNMKRMYAEAAAIVASFLGFFSVYSMYVGGDPDDIKENVFASSCIYLADRLISETIMYNGFGTVQEVKTLWSNPIAGGAFYIDVVNAGQLAMEYMFGLNPNFNPVYEKGPYKGQNKFEVLAKRNFWLTRIYNRVKNIGQLNGYYRIGNKEVISHIAKATANSVIGGQDYYAESEYYNREDNESETE